MLKKQLKENKKVVKNSSEEEQTSDRSEVSTNEFENAKPSISQDQFAKELHKKNLIHSALLRLS